MKNYSVYNGRFLKYRSNDINEVFNYIINKLGNDEAVDELYDVFEETQWESVERVELQKSNYIIYNNWFEAVEAE